MRNTTAISILKWLLAVPGSEYFRKSVAGRGAGTRTASDPDVDRLKACMSQTGPRAPDRRTPRTARCRRWPDRCWRSCTRKVLGPAGLDQHRQLADHEDRGRRRAGEQRELVHGGFRFWIGIRAHRPVSPSDRFSPASESVPLRISVERPVAGVGASTRLSFVGDRRPRH